MRQHKKDHPGSGWRLTTRAKSGQGTVASLASAQARGPWRPVCCRLSWGSAGGTGVPAGLLLAGGMRGHFLRETCPEWAFGDTCTNGFPRSQKSAQLVSVDILTYATPISHHALSIQGFNISGKNTRPGWQELGSEEGWDPPAWGLCTDPDPRAAHRLSPPPCWPPLAPHPHSCCPVQHPHCHYGPRGAFWVRKEFLK